MTLKLFPASVNIRVVKSVHNQERHCVEVTEEDFLVEVFEVSPWGTSQFCVKYKVGQVVIAWASPNDARVFDKGQNVCKEDICKQDVRMTRALMTTGIVPS